MSERPESSLLDSEGRSVVWVAVAAIIVGVFWFVAGPVGAGGSLVVLAVLFVVGTPYAIAVSIVALTVVTPDGLSPLAAILAVSGLLAMVLAPTVSATSRGLYLSAVFLGTTVLGAVAVLAVAFQPLWLAAGVLVGVSAVLLYVLDRFHKLRLGLLDGGTSKSETANSRDQTTSSDSV